MFETAAILTFCGVSIVTAIFGVCLASFIQNSANKQDNNNLPMTILYMTLAMTNTFAVAAITCHFTHCLPIIGVLVGMLANAIVMTLPRH